MFDVEEDVFDVEDDELVVLLVEEDVLVDVEVFVEEEDDAVHEQNAVYILQEL